MTDALWALAASYHDDSAESSLCATLLDCLERHGLDETVYQARLLRMHRHPRTNALVARALAILAPDGVPAIEAESDEEIERVAAHVAMLEDELDGRLRHLHKLECDAGIAKAERDLA